MSHKASLRIRIEDIPAEGKSVDFQLGCESLNARIALDRATAERASSHDRAKSKEQVDGIPPPSYFFTDAPEVEMNLQLEVRTVVITGRVSGVYVTPCARCLEEARTEVDFVLDLVLKPASNRNVPGADEEDLHFGVYDGEEVDCTSIAEEFLVLSLPFVVVCSETCKGLCPQCGKNLNQGACGCKPKEVGDPRLSVLRDLKLTQ